MFSLRSIFKLCLFLAFAAIAGRAQINPANQIAWPTGPTGCFYVPGSNTCVTAASTNPNQTPETASFTAACGSSYRITSGTVTVTLPASGSTGCNIVVQNVSSAAATITSGTVTYNGPTTLNQYQGLLIQYDGTNFNGSYPVSATGTSPIVVTQSPGAVFAITCPTCSTGGGTNVGLNSGSSLGSLAITGFMPQPCSDTSGSGTAQSCSTATSFTPQANNCVVYTTTTANSGTGLTVNINSLGAKSVAVASSSGFTTTLVASSSIPANKPIHLCYDGTNWNASGTGYAAASAAQIGYGFTLNSGVAASPAFPNTVAPRTGTITTCKFLTQASDGSTDLTFNLKVAGTSILSGSTATITHATSSQTVTTLTLTGSISVTAGNIWEFDITAGTSTWTGSLTCY